MIEAFVVGTGARVKRALGVVVGGGGVRGDGAEGMGIEVRGRMGRGGLKGSFFVRSLVLGGERLREGVGKRAVMREWRADLEIGLVRRV